MGIMMEKLSDVRSGMEVPMIAIISNPKSTTNVKRMPHIQRVIDSDANIVH